MNNIQSSLENAQKGDGVMAKQTKEEKMSGPIRPLLPPDYVPNEKEPFMNPQQLEYFRQKIAPMEA